MKLRELLEDLNYQIIKGNIDSDINEINYDSRKVKESDIFVCIKGFQVDGHKFIDKAIENGAKTIIVQDDVNISEDVNVIKLEDTRKGLAILGSKFYENPKDKLKIIGVTGTNGKTTTAFMIKKILEENGSKVGLIGTIANYIGNREIQTERTTPESLELHGLFKEMVDSKVEYCVMEVSSHSLELDRVYGIEFEASIFTNLTRDHLDFHKTFENYYKAKFKLFERSKISIVNIDDEYGVRVTKDLENLNKKYKTYSIKGKADIEIKDKLSEKMDTIFKVSIGNEEEKMCLPIPGEYNVANALGAIGALYSLNFSLKDINKGLKDVNVPGRCERCAREFNLPFEILIDYAHTPDGLRNILETAKEFTEGKLIALFGCGGDRDKTKRPQMGEIGTNLSDFSIITSDNPRTEDPEAIIEDIIKGIKKDNYIKITDRKEAIRKAIDLAKEDDVIVIAGKGHETYQVLNTGKIHFDEREVIEEYLKQKRGV
ncbi:UDP-N-acetylmuramoyl-L-alanyl-D-glutamate--2,6-diaminopimelate ligase [Clostridium sp. LY3-2]|uniref:UDP-N-acetylmuramoyl-L-alanyl-D-glutamate--2, 6-diaminopimelate ligase n=2 Tax=Clostridium TaxID=1485 RepID=UPI002152A589|nr:UDP-N-acetylmuramoyl-L-alanyl-D-glutamate--2,6-diaminopimelate ligase [Clostridium sp. LY3-2]MCR6515410.1 UDP-N-acetylmuramoyl-L-alanyl-D-glutamate--2,6-diaminopimelate ligase [Clostridium sp. LY3-2]